MEQTVLIVEDDEDLRHYYATSLALAGFRVESVSDGFEALRKIEVDPPDVIVLDLGLPMLPGESVLNELAANAVTRAIPIVVVTGQALLSPPTHAACVLLKPVHGNKLVATVQRCLIDATAPVDPVTGKRERRRAPRPRKR